MPSAGRVLDVATLAALRARGVEIAFVTHAAGLSAVGDPAIDAALPLPERYEVPAETQAAVARAKRVVAVGTSVVRALEGAAASGLSCGITDLRLGPGTRRQVVDAIVTGVHEAGTSHHTLLEAFAASRVLEEATIASIDAGLLAHEFGDVWLWRVLSAHCAKTGERIPSLRQVFSCGAPVPANVLRATLACVGEGANMHTPYGMTECLPVSTIEAAEVLENTASRTDQGAGVCVGRKFESIEWRVIRITDEPIGSIEETEEMPTGEIGELVVRGPQVSPCYVTRQEANAAAKISAVLGTKYSVLSFDPEASSPFAHPPSPFRYWHRTGDVGYFDDSGRFWYCGRKSQRIESAIGPLYTECVEAVATSDPRIRRCALVGLGKKGMQIPVLVVEQSGARMYPPDYDLLGCLQSQVPTHRIQAILYYGRLPVDVRHNAKINRELLTRWAAKRIGPAVATQSVGVLRSHAERGGEG
jgi:acyl-CoA synthetase (AMP-forming)/AMP-acid ligase II